MRYRHRTRDPARVRARVGRACRHDGRHPFREPRSTRCRRCAAACRRTRRWRRSPGSASAARRRRWCDRPMRRTSRSSCAALPLDIPVHVIGACSNLIIRDGGLPGVVIRLARGFGAITVEADGVIAGAAALDVTRRRTCRRGGPDRARVPLRHSRQHRRRGGDERRRLWRRHRVLSRLGRDRHAHRRAAPPRRRPISPLPIAIRGCRTAPSWCAPGCARGAAHRPRSPRAWRRSARRARPRSRCARAPAARRSAIRRT